MLTVEVRAADLADLHELHHAALGGGMFYNKPYRDNGEIVGAEGTLLTVGGGSLVACTMAPRDRVIIHCRIPCTSMDNNTGALFALHTPKDLSRPLRRFRNKPLTLRFVGGRLEIVLPRPGNARGRISLPMEPVNGRMLSLTCREPTADVSLNVDLLVAALRRVPRNQSWCLLAILPSDAGVDLCYVVNGATTYEHLHATKVERSYVKKPFLCSARRVASFVRVLQSLRKRGQAIRVQISASRLAIWNDAVTVQFFPDRSPSEWEPLSTADTNAEDSEIQLFLDRRMADIPKEAGKWLRRLVRNALTDGERVETTWHVSRDQVVVELDCGIQTSLELPCTCDRWLLDEGQLRMSLDPLVTASILECLEEDRRGVRLVHRDGLLAVQSGSRPHQVTIRVAPASSQGLEGDKSREHFNADSDH